MVKGSVTAALLFGSSGFFRKTMVNVHTTVSNLFVKRYHVFGFVFVEQGNLPFNDTVGEQIVLEMVIKRSIT